MKYRRHCVPIALASSLCAGVAFASCQGNDSPTAPAIASAAPADARLAQDVREQEFTRNFHLERCTFSDRGRNLFFILQPGYTTVYRGTENGETTGLTIRVLHRTERVGGVTTRVVVERETANGELVEISRNFFAICKQNNSVFYFGEQTDIYEHGKVVSHEGSWRHGSNGARAGLFMPGLAVVGSRFFQEEAPGVALDRSEIVNLNATLDTPLHKFTNVLVSRETTPLEPGTVEFKWYAPDVGLISDGPLRLVKVGFQSASDADNASRSDAGAL
jgi:hypothetical protein